MSNTVDFEQWDNQFDSEALKNDLADVENKSKGEYKEVPPGQYEVKITKLELTQSKKGNPMISCWFKIVAGEFNNQMIFMNQVLTTGFGLHLCNELLRSITSLPVSFESFKQYSMLLMDIMEEIEGKREFQLNYGKDQKGYNTFKIEKIFDMSEPQETVDEEVPV